MTTRQKEFVRHYLLGLSAPAAAKAAGYAACTAEKNAAAILSSPTITAHIASKRAAATLVSTEHLLIGRDRMLKIIETGTDKEAALAYHALLKLCKLQNQLAGQDNPQDLHTSNKNCPQSSDNQDASNKEIIMETDALPSGEDAFDRTFSPSKPTHANKTKTLILNIHKGEEPNHKPFTESYTRKFPV